MRHYSYRRRYCQWCGATLNSITHEYLICGDCENPQDNNPNMGDYDPYTGEYVGSDKSAWEVK